MTPLSVTRRFAAAAAGTLLLAGLLPAHAQAAPAKATPAKSQGQGRSADYDSRQELSSGAATLAKSLVAQPSGSAVRALHDELGVQGVVDIDRTTGTPRRIAKLDGFLTAPSKQKPAAIALAYVKAHLDAFGLTAADVASLKLRQDYVDIDGTHHLSFQQTIGGVTVFGNGLKAHVTSDGRIVQFDGSPLKSPTASAATVKLTAAAARQAAVKDVFRTSSATVTANGTDAARTTTFSDGGNAKLVYFQTARGARLAWQTVATDTGYLHVVDAASGEVLYRQDFTESDSAQTWTNYPGAPVGGKQQTVSLSKWLPDNAPTLSGNVAHVYSDVNDDNLPSPSEEVTPSGKRSYNFKFTKFAIGGLCTPQYQCSWDGVTPYSWEANREQNATQIYYYLGTWHDHLNAAPIGFTRAAGNFEARDGDAVQAQSDDGADTAGGLPDGNHVDNANMGTPPDGTPPQMQMYLWEPDGEFLAGNSGDESDIIYHEYTHGLSNRLVVDADGVSTLGGVQAGAMGEAWSDWYAMDYLVDQGLQKDTKAVGEVKVGVYVTGGSTIRSEPTDCPVGSTSALCPGTAAAGPGGYTYGDYGRISSRGAEVHADGEIWAQTLWDLRTAIGSKKAEQLVTRAMELSPANPSMLDERNSILAADLVADGGKLQKTIWQVFAKRGMGYFAAAVDGDDSAPVEDFSLPPAANTPRGSLTGKVTDADSGAAVSGATVAFGGHNSGFAGDYSAISGANGTYTISGILPGTYPKVFAKGAGYDSVVKTVTVSSHATTQNWTVRRDWAAAGGGGSVVDFTGPDYTDYACGPGALIDQSQSSGWGSDVADGGQQITIALPAAVNVGQLVINPSATCGDGTTSSTGGYKVETSTDGTTWTAAASGTFPNGTITPTTVPLSAGTAGVAYVRYSILTTQGQDAGLCPVGQPPAYSGCVYLDSTELSVYGTPAS